MFIYECGGMEWGGATIGWAYSSSLYEEHYLSGSSSSSNIGCRYSFTSSAIVYDVYDYSKLLYVMAETKKYNYKVNRGTPDTWVTPDSDSSCTESAAADTSAGKGRCMRQWGSFPSSRGVGSGRFTARTVTVRSSPHLP